MPPRIYPKRLPRLYLAEWRDAHRPTLTQKTLGERLGISDVTVSRWETGERRPDINAIAAYAEALDRELPDMFRHPDTPSADELLRGQTPEVRENVFKMLKGLRSA